MGVAGSKNFYSDETTDQNNNHLNNEILYNSEETNSALGQRRFQSNKFPVDNNSRKSASSSNANPLNSLCFHDVCGKNVILNNNKQTAKRSETSFCDAIVFSSRPIGVYERIYIKIIKLNTLWNGMIRFGFTSVNPDLLRKKFKSSLSMPNESKNSANSNTSENVRSSLEANWLNNDTPSFDNDDENFPFNLPKYVYPDLTNKKGYWAAAMNTEEELKENDVIYFYVNSNGEIHFGINNKYKGKFLDGVNVYNNRPQQAQPLWAIFDIYGNTLSIELINNPLLQESNQNQINRQFSELTIQSDLNDSNIYDSISGVGQFNAHNLMLNRNGNNNHASLDSTANSITASSLNSSNNSSTSSYNNNSNNNITVIPNRPNEDQLDRLFISCRRLCVDNHLNETLRTSILDANAVNSTHSDSNVTSNADHNEKIRSFYQSIPTLIHDTSNNPTYSNRFLKGVHGKNVKINEPDGLICHRESSIATLKDRYNTSFTNLNTYTHSARESNFNNKEVTRNAYAFLERPIQPGRCFCIQIVGIDQSVSESKMSLGIGCTTCKPTQLNPLIDLPDDADDLLDRPEYWIVHKNLFDTLTAQGNSSSSNHQISVADELCFCLDDSTGNLTFYLNNQLVTTCLFNVDLTQELYFFFDLCGKSNAIRLIPSCQSRTAKTPRTRTTTSTRSGQRPNSALIEYYKNQFMTPEIISENKATNQESLEECKICLDAPIECVFYTCGHMCVCWNCAVQLKKDACKPSVAIPTTATTGSIYSSSSTLRGSPTPTTSTSRSYLVANENDKKSKHPLCPICRNEIMDIIRFFKS
jgi:hypothetical protein